MRIELAAPGTMTGLLDLNTLASQRGEAVATDMHTALDRGINITDIEVAANDEEATADLLESLQATFYPYADGELEAQMAAFRGIAFATNLATRLTQNHGLETGYDHLPVRGDGNPLTETAIRGACNYLISRPHLDRLIGKFVHLIEPEPSRTTNAKLVVAHQCEAIDRHMQTVYSQKVLSEGIAQIRQWDGVVPNNLLSE